MVEWPPSIGGDREWPLDTGDGLRWSHFEHPQFAEGALATYQYLVDLGGDLSAFLDKPPEIPDSLSSEDRHHFAAGCNDAGESIVAALLPSQLSLEEWERLTPPDRFARSLARFRWYRLRDRDETDPRWEDVLMALEAVLEARAEGFVAPKGSWQ